MIRNPLVLIEGTIRELPVGDTVNGATGGLAEGDEIVYSKRIDFVSDSVLYKGEAAVGSLESASVWRIRKVVIGVDSDVTETWAGGDANFNKVWADRLTLNYS